MGSLNLEMEGFEELRVKQFPLFDIRLKIFMILKEFLQPNTDLSLESVARDILAMLPDNALSPDTLAFGRLCLELAEQIPYYHPSHVKLARLVERMGRCTKLQDLLKSKTGEETSSKHPRLKALIQDTLPAAPDGRNPIAFANWHAFVANLFERGIWGTNPTYAIRAMRAAFEEEPYPGIRHDYIVTGAAQWIIWNGHGLFQQVLWHDEATARQSRIWRFGLLYDGDFRRPLGRGRWDFWKDGFRKAATEDDYATECRDAARRAVEFMNALEAVFHE